MIVDIEMKNIAWFVTHITLKTITTLFVYVLVIQIKKKTTIHFFFGDLPINCNWSFYVANVHTNTFSLPSVLKISSLLSKCLRRPCREI